MDDQLNKLVDYALAAVFLGLYVKAQMELVKVYKEIAEQRRDENREMRNLLFELARRGVGTGVEIVDRAGRARIYDTPDDWNDRPITETKRPAGFPPANTGP